MHFLQALVLFFVVFAFVGVPGDEGLAERLGGPGPQWGVVELVPGGAAEAGGILPDDQFVSIDGHEIDDQDDVKPIVVPRAGDTVDVVVLRDGAQKTLEVTIGRDPDAPSNGLLGVVTSGFDSAPLPEVKASVFDSGVEAVETTSFIAWEHVKAIGDFATGGLGDFADRMFGGDDDKNADGPVVSSGGEAPSAEVSADDESRPVSIFGIARIGAGAAEDNLADLLILMGVVNVSIGLINLLPLLPLDGGHIAIAVYERVRSRKGRRHMADVSRLLPLTYAVVLLLGLLMMSSLYLDIVDPIGVG